MKILKQIAVLVVALAAGVLTVSCPANHLLTDVQQTVNAAKVSGTVMIPVFNPPGGPFTTDQYVSISCSTNGATIHYTVDQSTPTVQSPTYSSPIMVTGDGANVTIKAIAVAANMNPSSPATASYVINYNEVATPVFSPVAGPLPTGPQTITITDATPGATIYYTTDGSTPSTGSTQYAAPLAENGASGASLTVKAIAVAPGLKPSTASATYNFSSSAVALWVNVYPSASDGSVNQSTTYPISAFANSGIPYPLKAEPSPGWGFKNWTITAGTATFANNDPTAANTTVIAYANVAMQANFAQYSLSVGNDGNGTTTPTGASTVGHGVSTPIAATPATGYHFVNWTVTGGTLTFGSGGSTANPDSVTLTSGDAGIKANFAATPYTLTVNKTPTAGGTALPASISPAYYNTPTAAITATPAAGYSFGGWSGSGVTFSNQSATSTTVTLTTAADATALATFNLIQYTITYNNDGTSTNPTSYYVTTPTITLQPATWAGYTFGGWYTDAGLTVPISTIALGSIGNVAVYAKWTPITYNITYNLNGGTNGSNPATYNVTTPTITLQPATRTGYTFGGWYTDAGLTVSISTIPLGSTGNVTVYAKWTLTSYSITYNLNGGTNGSNPASYNITTPTITLQPATRAGYTFGGWYTDAGLTVSISTILLGSTGNVAVYAKWTPITYSIAYNLNGGTNGSNPATYNVATPTITLQAATRTGYTFGGWYTDAGLTVSISTIPLGSTGNVTVYAKWTLTSYSITYNLNGGTNGSNPASYNITTPTITLQAATRAGCTFGGWYTDAGLTISISTILLGSTGNVTVYAKWSLITYNITYNLNGGTSGSNPATYNVTTPTITLQAATRTGYTFGGWYTDAGLTVSISTIPLGSTGNVTVYAKWTPQTFTVTFDAQSGSTPSPTSKVVTYAAAYGTLATTSRTGYNFGGWFTGTGGSGSQITAATTVTITGAQTLYAYWTIITYTLTINNDSYLTSPQAGSHIVNYGAATIITCNAITNGYYFTGWIVVSGSVTFGDASSASTTVTLTNGAATIKPTTAQGYKVTIASGHNATPVSPFIVLPSVQFSIYTDGLYPAGSRSMLFDWWTVSKGTVSFTAYTNHSTFATATAADSVGTITIVANYELF